MKSGRQFVEELLNVRLQATNVSLWHIQGSLITPALRAVNDGIAAYEAQITLIYTSIGVTGSPQTIVLPKDVGNIIRLDIVGSTFGGRRSIADYRHVKTAATNILQVGGQPVPFGLPQNFVYDQAELEYQPEFIELPPDVALMGATLTTTGQAVGVTGGTPAAVWRTPGYFEISWPLDSTDVREVIRYDIALPTGFTGLTRAVEGIPIAWTQGAKISPVYEAPDRSTKVIMSAAQAVMYEYWARDRAMYMEYSSVVGNQAMEIGDVLALSRAFEDKADRAHKKLKKVPEPTQARVRVRKP